MARVTIAGVTVAAMLAFPGAALADVRIQAVDGTPDGTIVNSWSPSAVTIQIGESVTWSFDGTASAHNIESDTGAWTFANARAAGNGPATYKFETEGTYTFVCFFHRSTMTGTITVGNPPPPPPPPLSAQPFVNDFPAPTVLEVRDTVAPKLDRVSVTRVRKGAKIRLRLSEAGKVAVKLTHGKTVKRRTVEVHKGMSAVTVNGLRAGTYRVDVSATDLAGNAAKSAKPARVTVRS
jgi:plastocyanin